MKHLDLFAGIGGFSLALQNVVGQVEGGFSEIDKYATQIYKKHFPEHTEYGDITAIRERELPYFDLITFGFPCQDLSIAGKRKGFDGHRSSLFHEAIRIINEVRPKYFVFENVKGLYSSRKGEDFITVLQTITDIGYSGQWQLLNTKWFLPQNRERIYFVGHLRGTTRPKVFPIGEDGLPDREPQFVLPTITSREGQDNGSYLRYQKGGGESIGEEIGGQRGVLNNYRYTGTIAARDYKGGNNLIQIGSLPGYDSNRIYDSNGIAKTIASGSMAGGEKGQRTGLYMIGKDICPTIPAQHSGANGQDEWFHQISHDNKIRRLTPTECERLQGFPDGWTDGISDTQRYKTLGNSITVNVAQEIFKRLYD